MDMKPAPEIISQRLKGQLAPAYLTLTSIIQGVAFAFLATRVEATYARFDATDWLLTTATFLGFLTLWNEYLMQILMFVWVPTLVDSLVPFAFLASELFAAHFVYHDLRSWLLSPGTAYLPMHEVTIRKSRTNSLYSTPKERSMTDSTDTTARFHMIDLPDGRFQYLSWGAERTALPPMLLLHGITSSAQSWVRVGPVLADRYRVYALDMRGHGDSIKPSRGVYSLRHTADDALALIEALSLEHPVVIGHSWGGATAMVLASGAWSQKPVPNLSHVILEDPAHQFGRGNVEERAALYTKDIGRPADELRPEITASNPGWTEADIEGKIDALQKVTREAVLSVFNEAGQAGELLPVLARIAVPTLLIRADAALGTILDDTAWEQAKQYLPAHSRAVQIDGATHNVHRSQFDAFMQAVNDFLRQE